MTPVLLLSVIGDGVGRGHPHGARCGSWPTSPPSLLLGLVILVVLTAEGHGRGPRRRARAARRVHRPRPLRAAPRSQGAASAAGPRHARWVRPTHGVLIMNLRSGGGKAERFALAEECRRRGIEPVILEPGDDLLELARSAIDRGADVIGMAGGDGSQALVASVAMAADVPLVCVPAGTRNRFALDLGLDRNDVVAALDAFDAAVERRIDLGDGERADLRQQRVPRRLRQDRPSPEYREAKRQTTTAMLSGPGGSRSGAVRPPLHRPRWHPSGRRADHPGVQQPLPADVLRRVRQPGPPRHRRARRRRRRPPRRQGHRRVRRRPVDGPPRPVPRLDALGDRPSSPSSRADRSRRGWTARPCCSTRRSSSAACPARSGSASPPRRPATHRPPSARRRRGGR